MAQRRRSPRVTQQCRSGSPAASSDSDEPCDGRIKYDVQHKLANEAFSHTPSLQTLEAHQFTLVYIKKTGFTKPILLQCAPEELDLRMPGKKSFSVSDVARLVGKTTKVDVVEVNTQAGRSMTLDDFIKYYKQPKSKRKELLNLLSLEFSRTHLEDKVKAPKLVQTLDWVETSWPKPFRDFNARKGCHLYPKVQHYCLMSVEGCFTDFHIDFGGTSVWYHLLKGKKVFWLVEPTPQNVRMYDEWLLSGSKQNDTFFGDIVERCERVHLDAGDTFMIPSGWIHAVYTAADSLVFGGNFLHDYAIPMQLRIWDSENTTHVGKKFRYPQFVEMQWYAAARIVAKATGRQYVRQELVDEIVKVAGHRWRNDADDADGNEGEQHAQAQRWIESHEIEQALVDDTDDLESKPHRMDYVFLSRLTSYEIRGYYELCEYLSALPESRRSAPLTILPHRLDNLLTDLMHVVKEAISMDDDALATEVFGSVRAAKNALDIEHWPAKNSEQLHNANARIHVDDKPVASTSHEAAEHKAAVERRSPSQEAERAAKSERRASKKGTSARKASKTPKKETPAAAAPEPPVQTFTPAGEFVALGKRPLQSMLRRGPNVSAQSPYSAETKPSASHSDTAANEAGAQHGGALSPASAVQPARSILKRPKASPAYSTASSDVKLPRLEGAATPSPRPSESPAQSAAAVAPVLRETQRPAACALQPAGDKQPVVAEQCVPAAAAVARENTTSPTPAYVPHIAKALAAADAAEANDADTLNAKSAGGAEASAHLSVSTGDPPAPPVAEQTSARSSDWMRPAVSERTAPVAGGASLPLPPFVAAGGGSAPAAAAAAVVDAEQPPIHLRPLSMMRHEAADCDDPLGVLDELADGLRDAALKLPNNRYAKLGCEQRLTLLCDELDELLRMARSTLYVKAVVLQMAPQPLRDDQFASPNA